MKARLVLFFSNKAFHELENAMPLIEMDGVTSEFQNEEALRNHYQEEIQFYRSRIRNYIKSIPSEERKKGTVTLDYPTGNKYISFFSPLYHEDLERLNLSEFNAEDFIKKVRVRVQKALKEKTGEEISSFFRFFSPIYATEYNINRGYHQFRRTLSYSKSVKDTNERRELLKMFRESLELLPDKSKLSTIYSRARKIYNYAKHEGYLKKEVVQNLVVKENNFQAPMVVKKEGKEIYPRSFDRFLDEYNSKNPTRKASISDLAMEYEIESSERSNRR